MAIMKKDINFILLVLILVVLVLFSGFATYFQRSFKNLSTDYNTKLNELQEVTSDLMTQKKILNTTSYELEIKAKREEDYSTKYTTLKDERDKLADEKQQLETSLLQRTQELSSKISELESARTEIVSFKVRITELNDEIVQYKSKISSLNNKIDSICAEAISKQVSLSGC